MSHTSNIDEKLPRGRRQLVSVLRASGDVVHIDAVVNALSVTRTEAAKLLSRWMHQGWLRRVGSGKYVPASLDSLENELVLDDPWVLVPALFAPCYVGGRTAAEHWDLTEQIFQDVVVMTAQQVRDRLQLRHGTQFTLRHLNEEKIFGTRAVWRSKSKVLISDIHRTIIDMLNDPSLGGGIQHVEDCFKIYLERPDSCVEILIDYADRFGNGAVFKRLGFLAERHPRNLKLVDECLSRLTKGNAKLDPVLECPRLISRWRLWIPQSWIAGGVND